MAGRHPHRRCSGQNQVKVRDLHEGGVQRGRVISPRGSPERENEVIGGCHDLQLRLVHGPLCPSLGANRNSEEHRRHAGDVHAGNGETDARLRNHGFHLTGNRKLRPRKLCRGRRLHPPLHTILLGIQVQSSLRPQLRCPQRYFCHHGQTRKVNPHYSRMDSI